MKFKTLILILGFVFAGFGWASGTPPSLAEKAETEQTQSNAVISASLTINGVFVAKGCERSNLGVKTTEEGNYTGFAKLRNPHIAKKGFEAGEMKPPNLFRTARDGFSVLLKIHKQKFYQSINKTKRQYRRSRDGLCWLNSYKLTIG